MFVDTLTVSVTAGGVGGFWDDESAVIKSGKGGRSVVCAGIGGGMDPVG